MYDIFNYYNNDIGVYKLLHKKIIFWLIGLPIILFISVVLADIKNILNRSVLIGIFLVSFLGIFIIINNRMKKVLKKDFSIDSPDFLWNADKFRTYRINKLYKYIENQMPGLMDNGKLLFLINEIKYQEERNKVAAYLKPGLLAALFIPIWSAFISVLFEEITEFNDIILVLLVLFIISILIIYFISMGSMIFDDIFNSDYYKWVSLRNTLTDIYLNSSIATNRV